MRRPRRKLTRHAKEADRKSSVGAPVILRLGATTRQYSARIGGWASQPASRPPGVGLLLLSSQGACLLRLGCRVEQSPSVTYYLARAPQEHQQHVGRSVGRSAALLCPSWARLGSAREETPPAGNDRADGGGGGPFDVVCPPLVLSSSSRRVLVPARAARVASRWRLALQSGHQGMTIRAPLQSPQS